MHKTAAMVMFAVLTTGGWASAQAPKAEGQAKPEGAKKKDGGSADKATAKKGPVKTSSGLVYTELKAGSGPSPKATDIVKVHYRGTLTDGKEFDSSYKRGQPAEFPLNRVIPCWTEGVQMMKVGGKAKLECPSSIAYGPQGHPPVIPGGATLIFEIELLGINPK
jgi:FKBP-type peptidyl-prolyl cis-trans isomerase FkpA